MINTKKKIDKIKTQSFLKEFPIIFLLQHNNFTINDWSDFRQKIQKIQEIEENSLNTKDKSLELDQKSNTIKVLTIKNSLLKKILQTSYPLNNTNVMNWSFILQGPNFIVGCKNENNLEGVWNSIKLNPKLLFISCLYKNQLLNHLDFESLLKTNSSIYQQLMFDLDKTTQLYNFLQFNLSLQPINFIQQDFVTTLSLIKNN